MLIKSDFSHFSSQHFTLSLCILFTLTFAQCRVLIVLFVYLVFLFLFDMFQLFTCWSTFAVRALCTSLTTSLQQWQTQTTILKHLLEMQNLFKYILYYHNHTFLMCFQLSHTLIALCSAEPSLKLTHSVYLHCLKHYNDCFCCKALMCNFKRSCKCKYCSKICQPCKAVHKIS